MKLRNKKTGEIVDVVFYTHAHKISFGRKTVPKCLDYVGQWEYASLADLNEEWEDYEPKNPHINDGDARDAVYSWASALQIHQVRCKKETRGLGVEVTTLEATGLHSAPKIEFTSLDADVADGGIYTIDKLCEDEEE